MTANTLGRGVNVINGDSKCDSHLAFPECEYGKAIRKSLNFNPYAWNTWRLNRVLIDSAIQDVFLVGEDEVLVTQCFGKETVGCCHILCQLV